MAKVDDIAAIKTVEEWKTVYVEVKDLVENQNKLRELVDAVNAKATALSVEGIIDLPQIEMGKGSAGRNSNFSDQEKLNHVLAALSYLSGNKTTQKFSSGDITDNINHRLADSNGKKTSIGGNQVRDGLNIAIANGSVKKNIEEVDKVDEDGNKVKIIVHAKTTYNLTSDGAKTAKGVKV